MEEQEAWNLLRAGNREVFSQIYKEQYEALLNYGIRLCKEVEVAEDAIHDLFVELWKYRENLRSTTSIRFYLLKALRNKISANFSRNRLIQLTEIEELPFFAEFSFEASLIQRETEKEIDDRLKEAVNSLSERQKEVLYHRFFNNLDHHQIAELMGLSYQSTRNQLYLAVKALKERLPADWHRNMGLILLLMR